MTIVSRIVKRKHIFVTYRYAELNLEDRVFFSFFFFVNLLEEVLRSTQTWFSFSRIIDLIETHINDRLIEFACFNHILGVALQKLMRDIGISK